MNPDQPPKKPDEWSELEKDPKFQRIFRLKLGMLLLEKKFGEAFLEEHNVLTIRKMLEQQEQGIENDFEPLLPEVGELERKVAGTKSAVEMMELAKIEGVEFTPGEIAEIKKDTVEFFTIDEEN